MRLRGLYHQIRLQGTGSLARSCSSSGTLDYQFRLLVQIARIRLVGSDYKIRLLDQITRLDYSQLLVVRYIRLLVQITTLDYQFRLLGLDWWDQISRSDYKIRLLDQITRTCSSSGRLGDQIRLLEYITRLDCQSTSPDQIARVHHQIRLLDQITCSSPGSSLRAALRTGGGGSRDQITGLDYQDQITKIRSRDRLLGLDYQVRSRDQITGARLDHEIRLLERGSRVEYWSRLLRLDCEIRERG